MDMAFQQTISPSDRSFHHHREETTLSSSSKEDRRREEASILASSESIWNDIPALDVEEQPSSSLPISLDMNELFYDTEEHRFIWRNSSLSDIGEKSDVLMESLLDMAEKKEDTSLHHPLSSSALPPYVLTQQFHLNDEKKKKSDEAEIPMEMKEDYFNKVDGVEALPRSPYRGTGRLFFRHYACHEDIDLEMGSLRQVPAHPPSRQQGEVEEIPTVRWCFDWFGGHVSIYLLDRFSLLFPPNPPPSPPLSPEQNASSTPQSVHISLEHVHLVHHLYSTPNSTCSFSFTSHTRVHIKNLAVFDHIFSSSWQTFLCRWEFQHHPSHSLPIPFPSHLYPMIQISLDTVFSPSKEESPIHQPEYRLKVDHAWPSKHDSPY